MTAEANAEHLPTSPPPLRRSLSLLAFAGRSVGAGWTFRAAGLYAWAAAIAYVALAGAWSIRGEGVAAAPTLARALVWISWAGGTAAWAAARNVEVEEARLGLTALASLRGASQRAFFAARVLATQLLLARLVGLPSVFAAVVLSFVARSRDGAALVGAATVYALLFGAVFGGLARASSHFNPRHGRVLFVALVIGPEIFRGVFGDVPSLVSVFGDIIDLLLGVGGTAA